MFHYPAGLLHSRAPRDERRSDGSLAIRITERDEKRGPE
jgi:hypothetical protein